MSRYTSLVYRDKSMARYRSYAEILYKSYMEYDRFNEILRRVLQFITEAC